MAVSRSIWYAVGSTEQVVGKLMWLLFIGIFHSWITHKSKSDFSFFWWYNLNARTDIPFISTQINGDMPMSIFRDSGIVWTMGNMST